MGSWQKHHELQSELSTRHHCPKHRWSCLPQARVPRPGPGPRSGPLCFPKDYHRRSPAASPQSPHFCGVSREGAPTSDFPHPGRFRLTSAHPKGQRGCGLQEGRALKLPDVNIMFSGRTSMPCKPEQTPWRKYTFTLFGTLGRRCVLPQQG